MAKFEEVAARMEIQDALVRYCRGIDRRDVALVESAYHADAVDRRPYGPDGAIDAGPHEIAERAVRGFGDLPVHSQHHITNVTVELDLAAGCAAVESYVIAFHPVGPQTTLTFAREDGESRLHVIAGRYLDRFELRAGEWRIAERVLVVDWSREDLAGEPKFGVQPPGFRSGTGSEDPSYAHLERAAPVAG